MYIPDRKLWQNILAGDNKAWEELVRRYQALVYTVCIRSGLSLADAADCFQQTWVSLYHNRNTIQDLSRLSAWLVTTAKREVLRVIRQRQKIESGESLNKRAANDPLPDEAVEQLERQACLEIAMKQLDPRCLEIIELFFFEPEDCSYDQIANSLGISVNSLGPIRRRCLDKLRRILLKNGFAGVRTEESETL